MVLGVSTSWAAGSVNHGRDLVERCKALDITGLELDYRLPPPLFRQVTAALKGSDLDVVSLHNFCPIPDPVPWDRVSAEPFLLSHPHREERLRAVQWTIRTLEHANDLGARVVVLHCGRVAMDPQWDRLMALWRAQGLEGKEFRAMMARKIEERRAAVAPHLDGLLWSLDRLAREALRLHVFLGLENRAHYHELPGPDDFETIFSALDGAPLGYWHDTGHGHLMEIFGWGDPMELLSAQKPLLLGMHLHDVKGVDDHLPPGSGAIPFEAILRVTRGAECPLIVELKPGTKDRDVRAGLDCIKDLMDTMTTAGDDDGTEQDTRFHP
ncbi:MAG: TIM barrel protein [Desulfosoma sp.]